MPAPRRALLPILAVAGLLGVVSLTAVHSAAEETVVMPEPEAVLFDFEDDTPPWPAINDGVMGGLSTGGMVVEDGVAIFRGEVSLENNGGFASVRSRPGRHDLSAWQGLALRVRGDDQRYKLRLRQSAGFDGISYEAPFVAPAEWTVVRVPFSAFEAVFRGRPVRRAPPFDPSAIRTFGVLISDEQVGPFRLEINWIAGLGGGFLAGTPDSA